MKPNTKPTHTDWDEPHDVKSLAAALKRNESYVYDMKSEGFLMPGGRATLRMAFDWLAKHADFSRAGAAKARFARRRQVAGAIPKPGEETGRNGKSGSVATA